MNFLQELETIIKKTDVDFKEQDLLDLLKIEKRWPHRYPWGQASVEILTNTAALESVLFFNLKGYLNYEEWKKFYDLGFTTIISNVFDLTNQLRSLNKTLTNKSGLMINGNFYFSKPGQIPSFPYHKHDYDVIVKQIYGEALWKVENKEFILKPKDTCIIPKNTYHQVLSKNENKLSLTINIQ